MSLTHAHISLTPKCENPKVMIDFCLISLCNALYKVISKMLANRLKRVLYKYGSKFQSAFILGRSITNHTIVALRLCIISRLVEEGV